MDVPQDNKRSPELKFKRYVIKGEPVHLARARHSNGRVYDAQKHIKLVNGLQLVEQHEGPFLCGPLELDIVFYMPISKTSLKRAEQMKGTPHIYTPDLSNLIKFVEDIATNIIYKDDCLIASIIAKKMYDLDSRTEFTITEIKNGKKECKT
jgi:Holliday junction resolvase RusA-like endonuclease